MHRSNSDRERGRASLLSRAGDNHRSSLLPQKDRRKARRGDDLDLSTSSGPISIWIFIIIIIIGAILPSYYYYSLAKNITERYKSLEKRLQVESIQRATLNSEYVNLELMQRSLEISKKKLEQLTGDRGARSSPPGKYSSYSSRSSPQSQAPQAAYLQPVQNLRGIAPATGVGKPANCATSEPWYEGTPDIYAFPIFSKVKSKTDAFYVDIGAGDGVFQSKSNFFDKHLCWRGITIEPTEYEYAKLKQQRPNSIAVNTAISTADGMLDGFWDVTSGGKWTGWSGFQSTFSAEHRIEIEEHQRSGTYEVVAGTMQTMRLETVMSQYASKVDRVDYLSISVEGHELSVLQSADFQRVHYDIVQVACAPEEIKKCSDLTALMSRNNYDPPTRLWSNHKDLVFVRK